MGDFNRGSTGPGRGRDLARMPATSRGEGASGNVIPRGTTKASVRRGQALLRVLNDQLPDGQDFSRGSNKGGRRRNFSLMSLLSAATGATSGVQVVTTGRTIFGTGAYTQVDWVSEVYDYEDWWVAGAEFTVPFTGNFEVDYTFDVTQTTPSTMNVRVMENTSISDSQAFSSGTTPLTRTVTLSFTAGNIVSIEMSAPPDGLFIVTGTLTITPV